MAAISSNRYLVMAMNSCPFCSRPIPRRYEQWSREEALVVAAEVQHKKYGASKRAALVLGRDQSQVKAMIDRIAKGFNIQSLPSARGSHAQTERIP